jgi:chromosome segregation ATPase
VTARTPAQVLHEARQADSRDKRARVLATVADMESRHEPVTFTAVARAAGVSNWLVYATGIRERIEQARERQKALPRHELETGRQASAGAMQTDLALAREEIKALRGERDQLKAALRRQLGQQVDQIPTTDLIARVNELTSQNTRLGEALAAAQTAKQQLEAELAEAQDDLAAARSSLRQMIRAESQRG